MVMIINMIYFQMSSFTVWYVFRSPYIAYFQCECRLRSIKSINQPLLSGTPQELIISQNIGGQLQVQSTHWPLSIKKTRITLVWNVHLYRSGPPAQLASRTAPSKGVPLCTVNYKLEITFIIEWDQPSYTKRSSVSPTRVCAIESILALCLWYLPLQNTTFYFSS